MTSISVEMKSQIADLLADAARLIDDDALEQWAELFVADAVYRITTRENYDADLPISIVFCDSADMLRDRVDSLREANIYNIHYDRHLVTAVRVLSESAGVYAVHSSYSLYQTTPEGRTSLYSVGKYLDKVVFDNSGARFKERIVVADTAGIPNLLATPI
jgi:anthranilate 1,2-dioxygenase small subunit